MKLTTWALIIFCGIVLIFRIIYPWIDKGVNHVNFWEKSTIQKIGLIVAVTIVIVIVLGLIFY